MLPKKGVHPKLQELIKECVLVSNQKPSQIQDTLARYAQRNTDQIYQMPSLQQIQYSVRHIRSENGANIDTISLLRKYLKKNIYYGGAKDAKSDWVKEKLNIAEIVEPDYVTLAFAGDIMLDRNVAQRMGKRGLDYIFKKSSSSIQSL